ncbi:hypothetical protein AMJ40_01860, partial [candidate division TA06 bacterium DG_26]
MSAISVLAEHRRGELRDVTFEMLVRGRELAEKRGAALIAILLGHQVDNFAQRLSEYADRVILVDHPDLIHFNPEIYRKVLTSLTKNGRPVLVLIGHTAFGVDVAPGLSVDLNLALVT